MKANSIAHIILILGIFLASCSPRTVIWQNQKIYKINEITDSQGGKNKYDFIVYETTKPCSIKIKDNSGIQSIKFIDECDNNTLKQVYQVRYKDMANSKLSGKFYFPELDIYTEDSVHYSNKFKYYDSYLTIQPLVFTFKVRPHLSLTVEDSFPSKIETGINIGLSIGRKIQFYNFQDKENALKEKLEKRSSYAYGAFFNFSAAELNKANTRTAELLIARNVPVVSSGMYLSYGFNRFSVGYGLGVDFAIGPYSKRWIYQGFAHGKASWLWNGLFISIAV